MRNDAVTAQMSNDDILVEASGLKKHFQLEGERIEVIRDLSLTLRRRESVSIMGRSGAGKSTLLNLLGTLDRPDAGKVTFRGRDVFALSDRDLSIFRGQSIGFMFQFHHLLPEFSTVENVAMPALLAKVPQAEAYGRAESLLDKVGLADRLRHRPGELSGGEQQRVALARALVMEPELLLADEPTGNLDEATGDKILELLTQLREELGTSVVVVTHHESLANAMQRHLIMVDGRLEDRNTHNEQGATL